MNSEPSSPDVVLSIIVPCYNEEKAVSVFFDDVIKTGASLKVPFELIFIDDGSKDDTLRILREIAARDASLHYISLSRNFGKEAATLAGLQSARGEYIVTLDVDGQDPLSLIPEMLNSVVSGECDCAGARRVDRLGEPPVRSFFARRFYKLIKKFADIDVVDGARDFRLMSRKCLDALLSLPERNRFSKGILPWIGFKTKWFEYKNIERVSGKSKWSFWKLFLYALDGMIAFSSKPLAIASVMGFFLFIAALALIVFIVIRKLTFGDPVDGWASTVCIILLCSGIQLFTMGILGQYMAKTYTEVKQRPHFIIKEAK
ncbi:MAG: glycosyltransferase family 2 protein [Treponema sp.]|jgi:glycosyltransferase involved in cell wall biosynthesis|nr:glycosyltransferase family 2 protein [Treponema sp.]